MLLQRIYFQVWSVRSCEGSLKKRGHCLIVRDLDARALVAPSTINGKLSIRRTPADQLANQSQPRAVLRIANRVNQNATNNLEPFLQDLQNDVARLSRAFATLGREANALVREAEMGARIEDLPAPTAEQNSDDRASESSEIGSQPAPGEAVNAVQHLSRNARRRMRQRLRLALNGPIQPLPSPPARVTGQMNHLPNGYTNNSMFLTPSDSPPSSSSGPSQPPASRNKRKRRHRR